MISVYMDDNLFTSKLRISLDWIKENLKNEYNFKNLEKVKTIIGWQMTWNWDATNVKFN